MTKSRTTDDIGIACFREHVRLTALELHEGAIARINMMGFRDIQRCLMVPGADQVAMIALVNSFTGISWTV